MKPPKYHRMLEYDRSLLPNAHLQKLEAGVTDIETAVGRSGYSIGHPGWGLLYHLALCQLDRDQENLIVETGTNQSATTLVLAQALVDSGCAGQVVTIELEPNNLAIAQQNIGAAGLDSRVTLLEGDAKQLLPEALGQPGVLRLAFLDGSHLFDDVMTEFNLVLPRLEPDGVVAFDNTWQIAEEGEDQRVNGALKHIEQIHGGNLINLPFVSWYTPGLALWQRQPAL